MSVATSGSVVPSGSGVRARLQNHYPIRSTAQITQSVANYSAKFSTLVMRPVFYRLENNR